MTNNIQLPIPSKANEVYFKTFTGIYSANKFPCFLGQLHFVVKISSQNILCIWYSP